MTVILSEALDRTVQGEAKNLRSPSMKQMPRFLAAVKMVVPKAPWSAVASATAFALEFDGGPARAGPQSKALRALLP
jgi:hypothetical protein